VPAHANLFDILDCNVLISPNPRPPAVDAILASIKGISVLDIPSVDELVSTIYPRYPYNRTFEDAKNEPLVVLHTSGTTGLPKPIVWTHDWAATAQATYGMDPPAGYVNPNVFNSGIRAFSSFPQFHVSLRGTGLPNCWT
jgi:long-subunit acyl-CoA synthetase (AMP-forming)